MKKIAAIFLFITTGVAIMFGQEFSIGIKPSFIVLNSRLIADLSNLPFMEIKPRLSFGVGLTVSEQINRFGISLEPRFIVKGYNLDFGADEISIYRNNYLSLPLIFSYSPIRNLKLEIGPEFSYLLSSRVNYSLERIFRENESNNLRSFELSLIPGVSYNLIKRLDIGIRYGIGLTPFDKGQFVVNDAPFPPPDYEFTHRYFEFYLNTRIFVKK
jgi:hypothetical protein